MKTICKRLSKLSRYPAALKRRDVVLISMVMLSLLISFQALAKTDSIQTNVPALKNVYAHDFYIGCLLSYRHVGFATDSPVTGQSALFDTNGGYLIRYHMNSMSPGNNMKPVYTVDMTSSASAYNAATTQEQKDSADTHPVIKFNGDIIAQLNWARRQGFTFRGHTLVWYSQTPGTGFFRTGYSSSAAYMTKDKMIQRMDNYIGSVIQIIHTNWPGLLSAMDVVNEAVNDNGSDRSSGSEWFTVFGDNSYIMKAFEIARKYTQQYGETQLKLYYNDYNTSTSTKADGIVRVCGPIFRAGYLDGIGMQEHDALTSPTAAQWIATYNKFDTICTEMAVTELDINTNSGTNWPSAAILGQQANQYGQLFKCFVERSKKSGRGKIISVSKDGLNDSSTFVTNQSTSLWNAQFQCKPAFYAVVRVGMNYNALDSLITVSDTMHSSYYTTQSWSDFARLLVSAKNTRSQNYSVYISADTALGNAKDSLVIAMNSLVRNVVGVAATDAGIPKIFALDQNYPNPFNPVTQINYSIPEKGYISLKVFNLLGEEVMTLFAGIQQAGYHVATFNGAGFASGVYFYRLQASSLVGTKKLILLK